MNFLEIIGILSLNIITTCLVIFVVLYAKRLSKVFSYISVKTSELRDMVHSTGKEKEESYDSEELTEYEIECMIRDKDFDNRIAKMREELALQSHPKHTGTIAEELDPMVKNLPHDSVQTRYDVVPDSEVAE